MMDKIMIVVFAVFGLACTGIFLLFLPYLQDIWGQIKYDLKMSYYSPKYTKAVWGKEGPPSRGKKGHDNGSKW
jgi:hypothetical protein